MAHSSKNIGFALTLAFVVAALQSAAQCQDAPIPVGDVFYKRATSIEYSKPYSQILHPEALEAFEKAAYLGSDKAMVRLAASSKASKDISKAKYWYEKASEKGNLNAAATLGKIYIEEGNCARGLPLIEKTKDTFVFDSKYYLARILYDKACPDAPAELVVKINEDAANSGMVFSSFRLAKMYYFGEYAPKNAIRAWAYAKISSLKYDQSFDGENYKKADGIALLEIIDKEVKAKGLESAAWNELKTICENGAACISILLKDTPKDIKINIVYPPAPMPPPPPISVTGYNSMAMSFNPSISPEKYKAMGDALDAAQKAAMDYRKQNKGKINLETLRGFYFDAAELGNPISMYMISRLYFDEKNIKLGRDWLEKAALNGSYSAQWELANYLIDDKKDCQTIAKYLENAWRIAQPQYYNIAIGRLYNGEVCPEFKDEIKAINYYNRAANIGIAEAMIKLSQILSRKNSPNFNYIRAIAWGRIAYALSPSRGFFASSEVKELKQFLITNYKILNEAEKSKVISETNLICSAYVVCDKISDSDIMKLQGFEIN